jgi:hypothetical protein
MLRLEDGDDDERTKTRQRGMNPTITPPRVSGGARSVALHRMICPMSMSGIEMYAIGVATGLPQPADKRTQQLDTTPSSTLIMIPDKSRYKQCQKRSLAGLGVSRVGVIIVQDGIFLYYLYDNGFQMSIS